MLQAMTVPRPVKGRVTHHWQHLDEIGAMFLAMYFGEHLFPGIMTAPLIKWDAGQPPPDGRTVAEWEKDHFIAGTAGSILDEHQLSRHEREQHCAATLTAELLGLPGKPQYAHLKPLLDELVKNDRLGHRTVWDAFSICWALYYAGISEEQAETFFLGWFSSIYNNSLQGYTTKTTALRPGQPSLNDYLREFIVENYRYRGSEADVTKAHRSETARGAAEALGVAEWKEVAHLLKLENRLHTYGAATLLDIHSYVEAMALANHPETTIRSWVYLVLGAKINEQRLFQAAVDEVKSDAENPAVNFVFLFRDETNRDRLVRVNSGARERDSVLTSWVVNRKHRLVHEIAIVESANFMAHKAVRHLYKTTLTVPADPANPKSKARSVEATPDLIVLRKPTRHIAVFINDSGIAGRPLIRRIREAEYRKGPNANKSLDRSVLGGEYNIAEVPEWCWFPEGNQFLNSSLTAPNVAATRLSLETVVDLLIDGLRYLFTEPWKHKGRPQYQQRGPQKPAGTRRDTTRPSRDTNRRPPVAHGVTAALNTLASAFKDAGVVADSAVAEPVLVPPSDPTQVAALAALTDAWPPDPSVPVSERKRGAKRKPRGAKGKDTKTD
jgi:hypothetical protein